MGEIVRQRKSGIANGNKDKAVLALKALVGKCYKLAGYYFGQTQEESARNWEDTTLLLYEKLCEYYPNISYEVLRKVFEDGACGRYGKNTGLSVTRFLEFLDLYFQSKQGVNIQQMEEEQPKLLQRDEDGDTINFLQFLYTEWQNHNTVLAFDAGKMIIFLWNHGLCQKAQSKEVQDEFIQKAKDKLDLDRLARISRNPFGTRSINDEYKRNLDENAKHLSYKLVIYDFFNDIHEMDVKDIHELFENPEEDDNNGNSDVESRVADEQPKQGELF